MLERSILIVLALVLIVGVVLGIGVMSFFC